MRGKPSLIELSNSPYQWKARWKEGDETRFKYFKKGQKGEAEAFIKRKCLESENYGSRHGSVTDDERAALIRFRDAISAMPEPRPTLNDCVDVFLATIANQLVPITISELVESRVAAAERKGVHSRTLKDLAGIDGKGGRLGAFAATFGDRQAATVTAKEIEEWGNEKCKTEANRRETLMRIHGLFAHAVKRRHIAVTPFAQLEMPRPSAARATILSVSDCAKLLSSCPARSLPALAVQLFAGLRHAEAERLTWEKINFESGQLEVTQRKGVGRKRELKRFVDITPALKEWLKPYRQPGGPIFPEGRSKGKVSSQAYRNDFSIAREQAGILEWDENTLRHCFGSYRLAETNDLKRTSVEMGHTNEQTTRQHYLNAVTSADGKAYWNLRPL